MMTSDGHLDRLLEGFALLLFLAFLVVVTYLIHLLFAVAELWQSYQTTLGVLVGLVCLAYLIGWMADVMPNSYESAQQRVGRRFNR